MSQDEVFMDGIAGLPGAENLAGRGGPIERPVPEDRPLPPMVDRPAPFPIKARLVQIVAFAGALGTADSVTGEVTGAGLIVNVRAWLAAAKEKDILDWWFSTESVTTTDADTGETTTATEGRFVILYTE